MTHLIWWYNAMEWYGQQGMNSTATYDEWIWSNLDHEMM